MTRNHSQPHSPWRERDFVKLWAAQGVSAFGARITREGLPMATVMTLGAAPGQIGVLAALSSGPALIIGLMASGFVDRSRRRGLMIAMDLLRAVILANIPLAAWLHALSMPQLYLAAAVVGAASGLFQIADHAYLPGLVARERLTEANASLSATESVAEIAGTALAGVLFQWFAGPAAVAMNALTYLASAGFLGAISKRELAVSGGGEKADWRADIKTGFTAALTEPRVAPLLVLSASNALFGSFFAALYILFALRVLGLTPAMLGLTIAAGGAGALAGAPAAPRLARTLGAGPAIAVAAGGAALMNLLIPLAPAQPHWGVAFLMAAQVFGDALAVTAIILATSVRQTLLDPVVLGRVAASFQALSGGMAVVGALAGGALGGWIGPRASLFIAVAGLLVGPAVVVLSPLRRYREA
jgi:predicted MFS family arabinose efflux permease